VPLGELFAEATQVLSDRGKLLPHQPLLLFGSGWPLRPGQLKPQLVELLGDPPELRVTAAAAVRHFFLHRRLPYRSKRSR
jgi:hypothetical protein